MPKPIPSEPDKPANFDELAWHPIRLPQTADTRSGDFPALDTFVGREMLDMFKWISKNKIGIWWREQHPDGRSTFWFETREDAMAFAMRWFPYRCL